MNPQSVIKYLIFENEFAFKLVKNDLVSSEKKKKETHKVLNFGCIKEHFLLCKDQYFWVL